MVYYCYYSVFPPLLVPRLLYHDTLLLLLNKHGVFILSCLLQKPCRKIEKVIFKLSQAKHIRRALRHNVRTYADERYCNGDKVYYRRKNFKGWKGPGVVLGQDGQYVLAHHGGTHYHVHPCQLMKIHDVDEVDEEANNEDGNTAQSENDLNKEADNEDGVLNAEDTGNAEGTIVNEDHEESASKTGGASRRVVKENSIFTKEQRGDPAVLRQVQKSGRMPKPNLFIKIKLDNDSEWVKAKVLSF